MKILGIGVDLVQNSKIRHFMHQSYAQRFLKKFLHHREMDFLDNIENEKQKVQYLASRWAVKEALNKAIGRKELHFSEIRIAKDEEGTPVALIQGDQNQRLLLQLQISRWHVSLTHEGDYTLATAIVEQYPE